MKARALLLSELDALDEEKERSEANAVERQRTDCKIAQLLSHTLLAIYTIESGGGERFAPWKKELFLTLKLDQDLYVVMQSEGARNPIRLSPRQALEVLAWLNIQAPLLRELAKQQEVNP